MRKHLGVLVTVILIAVLVAGMAYLRRQMYRQTHDEEPAELYATALLKAQTNMNKEPLTPGREALIETEEGNIRIVLYEKNAPRTTRHFITLIKDKFYDISSFHRVVPGFVIQGGQPEQAKAAGKVDLELAQALKHDTGAVAMARTDDPNSATCEFYITLSPHHELDDKYAVFGKVLKGMDVAKRIKEGSRIWRIRMIGDSAPKPSAKEAVPSGHNQPK